MLRFRSVLSAAAATAAGTMLAVVGAAPAHAATGDVIVFKTELEQLSVYENPDSGCYRMPGTAHVLVNRTDTPVTIHPSPRCFAPAVVTVEQDHGWHAPPGGIDGVFSFRVG